MKKPRLGTKKLRLVTGKPRPEMTKARPGIGQNEVSLSVVFFSKNAQKLTGHPDDVRRAGQVDFRELLNDIVFKKQYQITAE